VEKRQRVQAALASLFGLTARGKCARVEEDSRTNIAYVFPQMCAG